MGQVKFTGWHIDGFGVFNNYQVKNLSEQITIFLGPNEAGKSTLLGFLRYMLFGFQPYSKENRYPPLQGGRHGGLLTLASSEGEYTLERYATPKDSCLLWKPDGSQGNFQDLAQLLGHADQQLYKSIFAFSLSELEDSKFQDSEQIHDRIVAGSLQGSKMSARDALKQIGETNASIHKPRGRKTKLQELKEQISTCKQKLEDAHKSVETYTALCREEAETENRLKDLGKALDTEQANTLHYQTLIDLWPQCCNRNSYHQALQGLETIETFPNDAQERHTALHTSLENLSEQASDLNLKEEQLNRQKDMLQLDPAMEQLHPQILGLSERKALYIAWDDTLQNNEHQALQAKQELERSFGLLGPDWDRERLSEYPATLPQMEEIRSWEGKLNQAHESWYLQEQRLQSAQLRVDETLQQMKTAQERLQQTGPIIQIEELDRQEETLTQLRIHLAEHKEKSTELSAIGITSSPNDAPSLSRIRQALWILTILLLGTGAMAFVTKTYLWGALLAIAGIAALGLSLFSGQLLPHAATNPERVDVSGLRKALQELEVRIHEEAAPFKPGEIPSIYETDTWVQRLARQREEAKSQKELTQEYKHVSCRLQEAQETLQEIKNALATTQVQEQQLRTEWNEWLRAHYILASTPQGALDFIQSIRDAQKSLVALEQAETSAQELRQNLQAFQAQLNQLLAQAGIAGITPDPLSNLERLLLRDKSNHENLQRGEELEKARLELNQQRETLSQKQKETQTKLDSLYAEAGATSEEDFRHRLEVFKKRQLLKQSLQDADMGLEQRIGQGESAEQLRQTLSEGEVERWKQAIAQSEQVKLELSQYREQALRRQGELGIERKKLEEASDINTLENQYQSLRETFARLTREWTVRALAEGMIKETFQELEQTRQPAVLAHASSLFSSVTGGKYEKVRQSEESGIQVVSRAQKHTDPRVLSRGTAEQLYLCLRLGLIREFSQQSGGLPLVMDDVLVNFDPERTRNLVQILGHFSEEQQILLFTCHPRTAETFNSLYDAQVIELQNTPLMVY